MTYIEILSIIASALTAGVAHKVFWTDHFSWENERPKPMKNGRRKTD